MVVYLDAQPGNGCSATLDKRCMPQDRIHTLPCEVAQKYLQTPLVTLMSEVEFCWFPWSPPPLSTGAAPSIHEAKNSAA